MRLINGVPGELLNASDRALQFGDGVFRTLRLIDGAIQFWQRHYAKLCADVHALDIAAPAESVWLDDIRALNVRDATLKLIVTRGETARGYAYPANLPPNRMVQAAAPAQAAPTVVNVRLCDTPASWQPRLAGIKHLNRLENVLARAEWHDPQIAEGFMLDRDGHVLEGTMSNILLLEQGRLTTPRLDTGGVAGVMRQVALDAAQALGWGVEEAPISLPRLLAAQRLWICNSVLGVVPVARLADMCWPLHAADGALQRQIAQMAQREAWLL